MNDSTRYCAVCGKDMLSPKTLARFVGVQIEIGFDEPDKELDLEFYREQFGVYADIFENGFTLGICWECWLKSLGVKPCTD